MFDFFSESFSLSLLLVDICCLASPPEKDTAKQKMRNREQECNSLLLLTVHIIIIRFLRMKRVKECLCRVTLSDAKYEDQLSYLSLYTPVLLVNVSLAMKCSLFWFGFFWTDLYIYVLFFRQLILRWGLGLTLRHQKNVSCKINSLIKWNHPKVLYNINNNTIKSSGRPSRTQPGQTQQKIRLCIVL